MVEIRKEDIERLEKELAKSQKILWLEQEVLQPLQNDCLDAWRKWILGRAEAELLLCPYCDIVFEFQTRSPQCMFCGTRLILYKVKNW